jgi:hypothetical protein
MHLTEQQLSEYLNRALSPPELLFVDDHVVVCADCCKKLSSVLQANSGGYGAVNFLRGELTATEEDFHLSFTELTAYLAPQLDTAARQTMADHLDLCSSCRAEIEDLQAFQQTLAQSKLVEPLKWWEAMKIGWWGWPVAVAAGLALVAIGLYRGRSPEPIALQPSVVPTAMVPPLSSAAPTVSPTPTLTEQPPAPQSAEDRAVQLALATGRIEIPAAVKNLRIKGGNLLSGTAAENAFVVVTPQGVMVESEQPRLHWSSLPSAKQYVVTITDQRFNEVAHSQALTALSWSSPVKLKRGELYQWQVTATMADGNELTAPAPSAPEARFKVLSSEAFGIVRRARARYAAPSVELGVIYAQVGLLAQAERELQLASRQSPGARRLLKHLRQQVK